MAQVNSENSTAMPVVSTRRRFLSQAAAVTAGGVALATALSVSASAAGAVQASDPILAAIEAHKRRRLLGSRVSTVTAISRPSSHTDNVSPTSPLGVQRFLRQTIRDGSKASGR